MGLYAVTIFLSAALLFQVQPVIAKAILPWFGGSAAVWAACMLFFETVLLLGYLYAHLSVRLLAPRQQVLLHLLLLAGSLLLLPIVPSEGWKPPGGGDPTARILLLLGATVGGAYFLLSATNPLLQAWYAREKVSTFPARLYALSNAGSMIGLLSYPVLVEPYFPLGIQERTWSAAYAAFAILCAGTGALGLFRGRARGSGPPPSAGAAVTNDGTAAGGDAPSRGTAGYWIALSACGVSLLLSVTNQLTQNVAAIPFLWIAPLSVYLLSFILPFAGDRWYRPLLFRLLLVPALVSMAFFLTPGRVTAPLPVLMAVFLGGLFVACMVCHGELARLRPGPGTLTAYYLSIALGGALGGAFVSLAAPLLFTAYHELPFSLAACAVLAGRIAGKEAWCAPGPDGKPTLARIGLSAATAFYAMALVLQAAQASKGALAMTRNFYGVLKVTEEGDGVRTERMRTLAHGAITHGRQFVRPDLRRLPIAYYGPGTGIDLAMRSVRPGRPRRVGVLGLGAGTLAAYGKKGDRFTFYEIDPNDVSLARTWFTYLADASASTEVVPGDARLSLEREAPRRFDILVADAFSGDSIPVHLLTREAVGLYLRHLVPDGVLAIHVSNKYLDLKPVVAGLAASHGRRAVVVETEDDPARALYGTTWVIVTANDAFLRSPKVRAASKALVADPRRPLWTDDYSNLLRALK